MFEKNELDFIPTRMYYERDEKGITKIIFVSHRLWLTFTPRFLAFKKAIEKWIFNFIKPFLIMNILIRIHLELQTVQDSNNTD